MADRSSHPRLDAFQVSVRPLKPRLVLAVLTVASFGGVWLATGGTWLAAVGRWLTVAATGALAGGFYWRVALVDGDPDGTAVSRWRAVRRWTALALLVGVGTVLLAGSVAPGRLPGAVTVGTLAVLGVTSLVAHTGTRRFRLAMLALALPGLAALAGVTTAGPGQWAVRTVHLGAFALWFGGALWHNAVVLPARRSRPEPVPAMRDAAVRFRRHLPGTLALLLATGGYQALSLVDPGALAATTVGRVVLLKLVLLAVLAVMVATSLSRTPR